MPISDEVIELAPVKKTKTTLIILISVIGVLAALAVTFLILYFLKPSVTEEKNNVKSISVSDSELFTSVSDSGVVKQATVGKEYTVYATVSTDNGATTDVNWDWEPRTAIQVVEQKYDGEQPYIKFIPTLVGSGQTVTIRARAATRQEEFQTTEFVVVNQGAEDIRVSQYGVQGSLHTVTGDSLDSELEIIMPYYTTTLTNNKSILVYYQQYGKYNADADAYADITSIDAGDGKKTDDVLVTSSEPDVVAVSTGGTAGRFSLTVNAENAAKRADLSAPVIISISANVNNDGVDTIVKQIKVKLQSNTELGYVDTMYFFNKPIVTVDFIKSMLVNGNPTAIDSAAVRRAVGGDRSLHVFCNDRAFATLNSEFELVLPYTGSNYTYDYLFDHLMLSPANIQYSGDKLKDNWYANLRVTSSDNNVLRVNTSNSTLTVSPNRLSGKADGKAACTLTVTDVTNGITGASISIPVRIVAQTAALEPSASVKVTSLPSNADQPDPNDVAAAKDARFAVDFIYNIIAPESEDVTNWLASGLLNDKYSLDFDPDKLTVRAKGGSADIKPGEECGIITSQFVIAKASGTAALTRYRATVSFEVTVKKETDGSALFRYIKPGSYLRGVDNATDISDYDAPLDFSATFVITQQATEAYFLRDTEDATPILDLVTENKNQPGYFERVDDNKLILYVQNRGSGTLNYVKQDNGDDPKLLDLVYVNAPRYKVKNYLIRSTGSVFNSSGNLTELTFIGMTPNSPTEACGTITFDITDTNDNVIGNFAVEIRVFNAYSKLVLTKETLPDTYYGANGGGSVSLANMVNGQFVHQTNQSTLYNYKSIDLYYINTPFDKDTNDDGSITFSHTFDGVKTPLYRFANRSLSAIDDIYAYSRKVNTALDVVSVKFLLNDEDEYRGKHYGDATLSSEPIVCNFIRNSDGIAVSIDGSYTDGDKIKKDDNGNFAYGVNQNEPTYLFISSVVVIGEDDDQETVCVEQKVDGKNNKIAAVNPAYFTLPDGIVAQSSSKVEGSNDKYTYISYFAPNIGTDSSRIYRFALNNGNTVSETKELTLTVNNAVRDIKSVSFHSAKPCTEDNKIGGLLFGMFAGDNKLVEAVYVKVEYIDYLSSHTKFADVLLSVPDYISISGRTLDGAEYRLSRDPADDVSGAGEYIFTCELTLNDKARTDENQITARWDSIGAAQTPACAVTVSTGLSSVTVKEEGNGNVGTASGNTVTVNKTFALKNMNDQQSVTYTFDYAGLSGTVSDIDYSGIKFDHKSLLLNDISPIDGLIINDNRGGDTSSFTISVDPNKITKLTGQNITLTFTDTNGGANNTFTVVINVTVTMDIYSLSYDGEPTVTLYENNGNEQSLDITDNIIYNQNGVAPTESFMNGAKVAAVYTKNNEEYAPYNSDDVRVVKQDNKYILYVANTVDWTNTKYYIGLTYPNVEAVYPEIKINTLTNHIEFADGTTADKDINVVVKDTTDTFDRFVAKVVNDGSGDTVNGTITYSVTGSCVAIDDNGKISLSNPQKITDTVDVTATYTDAKSGKTYKLSGKFTYYIAPDSVEVSDVSGNTLGMLFYAQGSYTSLDLANKIVASNAFEVEYSNEITYGITVGNGLSLTNTTIIPTSAEANSATVTVTATYNCGIGEPVVVSKQYTVTIVGVAALDLESYGGTINITSATKSLTVKPTITPYTGLTPDYKLTPYGAAADLFDVSENTITLKANANVKVGDTYTFTAALTYGLSAGSTYGISGNFGSTKTYTVTIGGSYNPVFDVKEVVGDSKTVVTPTTAEAEHKHIRKDGATYEIAIADCGIAGAAYAVNVTAGDNNLVGTVSDVGADRTATFTLVQNASGTIAVTVTVTVHGQQFITIKNYYITYGSDPTATLYVEGAVGEYNEVTTTSYAIDGLPEFKYEISGLSNETAIANNATVTVTGDGVTAGAVVKDNDKLYVIITVTKPTTLSIVGSMKVGSRTVYFANKTVTLTATEPSFALNVGNGAVLPGGNITLSVTNSDSNSVVYSIQKADGTYGTENNYATVNGAKLTAKTDISTDSRFTVRATVTVNSGAYKDKVYILENTVTVTGVALPTIVWNDSTVDLTVGGEYTPGYRVVSPANYSYNGKYSAENISVKSSTLRNGGYSFTGGKLTVTDVNGGTIILTVKVTINAGNPHAGESVSDELTVRVLPTVNSTYGSITLANAANTYDLNGDKFKSVFAPNGIAITDYTVTDINITNGGSASFATSGSMLKVNNHVTTATTLTVSATVLITSGDYSGVEISGTKTITFTVPNTVEPKNVNWNSSENKYNTVTENKDGLGITADGNTSSIQAALLNGDTEYVSIAYIDNNPTLTVDRNAGAYITGKDEPNRRFTVGYLVTLDSGAVYYNTVTYNIANVVVTVTASLDGTTVALNNGSATMTSGTTAMLSFTADKGFVVAVKNSFVTDSADVLTLSLGANGVQVVAQSVATETDVGVQLTLYVDGIEVPMSFTVKVQVPVTGAVYSESSRVNLSDSSPINTALLPIDNNNVNVRSTWRATGASYRCVYSLTVTAPGNDPLSKYFTQLSLNGGASASGNALSANSVTLYFRTDGNRHYHDTPFESFYLDMTVNTASAISLSTIQARLVTYYNDYSNYNSRTVTISYAIRVIDKLTVTLDANGGNVNVSTAQVQYKGNYTGLPTPQRTGYTFTGWYDYQAATEDESGNDLIGKQVVKTEDHTLYAHWTPATATLKFNANGGTDGGADRTVTYGSTYGSASNPLPAPTAPAGQTFAGWYTSAVGGEHITDNTVVTFAQNTTEITIYAHWEKLKYTVTLNANGGIFANGASQYVLNYVEHGNTINLSMYTVTQANHHLTGWSDGNKSFAANGDVTVEKDGITLTAQWEIDKHTVSFDFAGGSCAAPVEKLVEHGGTVSLSDYDANKTGHTLSGWKVGETSYATNGTVTVNGDITLVAVWTADKCSITFNLDGGTYSGVNTDHVISNIDYGTEYGISEIVPERTDYRFTGWTGATVTDGKVTVNGNITLTAQWVRQFTLSFALDGGSCVAAVEKTVDVGAEVDVSGIVPTKEGYVFDGWSGATVTDGKVTVNGNITLTAVWKQLFVVVLNNDGDIEIALVKDGGTYNLSDPAGKDGYRFDGWYNSENTKVEVREITVNGNITLTAHWTKLYTVTYVLGESATGTVPTQADQAAGAKFNLAASTGLAKENHTFGGWSDGTTTYQADDEYTMPAENVTLTAVWTADEP